MANEAELLYRIKVDAAQAISQMERASTAIQTVQRSAQASGAGFSGMQRGIQNASYQMQDFIVQVTGGQDAVRAFGQQAPQLLGSFGAVGAAVGVVAALIPVAVAAYKELAKAADDLETASKKAETAISDLKTSINFETRKSLDPLIESIKEGDQQTREWIVSTEELKLSMARLSVIDLRTSLVEGIKEGVKQLGIFKGAWYEFQASISKSKAAEAQGSRSLTAGNNVTSTETLASAYGIKESELKAVEDLVANFKVGTGDATAINDALKSITDRAKNNVPEVKAWAASLAKVVEQYEVLNRSILGRDAALNRVRSGNFTTVSGEDKEAKEAEAARRKAEADARAAGKQAAADLQAYNKTMADLEATQGALELRNKQLTDSGRDYLVVFERVSDATKQRLKLEEQYAADTTKYTQAQYEKLRSQLQENEALEKNNFLQEEANKFIDKSLTAKESYAQSQERLNYLLQQGAITQKEFDKAMAGAAEQYTKSEAALSQITVALGSAFSDAILNGKSFQDVLSGLAKTIAQVVIQTMVVLPLIKQLQAVAGTLFGGGGGGASGGAIETGSMLGPNSPGFADGAAFGGGNVIPFARGGVVTHPTFFPMANGRGLMAEAGPEAVMPLRRGADGKLGVAAGGAGGGNTQVIINNQSGGEVETQERQDPNGTKVIEVLIKKVMGDSISRGEFDRTLGSSFGLRRMGAR